MVRAYANGGSRVRNGRAFGHAPAADRTDTSGSGAGNCGIENDDRGKAGSNNKRLRLSVWDVQPCELRGGARALSWRVQREAGKSRARERSPSVASRRRLLPAPPRPVSAF